MFKSNQAEAIAHHWRRNFPKEATVLDQKGQLVPAAEEAADRAGRVREQALGAGKTWDQAEELSQQEWGTPPTLSNQ